MPQTDVRQALGDAVAWFRAHGSLRGERLAAVGSA
jgi:hypothetical protein